MPDFSKMTTAEFEAWKAENTPAIAGDKVGVVVSAPQTESTAPTSVQDTARAWSSGGLFDFVTPLGHTCQLRKPDTTELMAAGIIGKINLLKGVAEKLVRMGEGLPPEKIAEVVSEKDLDNLSAVLDTLMPIVVVQPKVWPTPTEEGDFEEGRIYSRDIDLTEKVAIMERCLRDVAKFATFRS